MADSALYICECADDKCCTMNDTLRKGGYTVTCNHYHLHTEDFYNRCTADKEECQGIGLGVLYTPLDDYIKRLHDEKAFTKAAYRTPFTSRIYVLSKGEYGEDEDAD